MKVIRSTTEMEAAAREARAGSQRIAFVPTMGALHEGHLALFREARRRGDVVVVSIFVNPTQFNDLKDFKKYPRVLDDDLKKCRAEKVDVVFVPTASEIYPGGFKIDVKAGAIARDFEGASRPGHFDGVVTVVARLFRIIQPHLAIFGDKDYQQLLVVRQLVRDLRLDIEIVGHPTVRTQEGLALSSRNMRLSPAGLKIAGTIPRALQGCERLFWEGERDIRILESHLCRSLTDQAGLRIDYAKIVDAESLQEISAIPIQRPAVALVACWVEGVRLIDNISLAPVA